MSTDWEQIYAEFAPRLRRTIARRVDATFVEDVLQETFLRAYRSRHTLDVQRPVGPWLTTIAIRASTDVRRAADHRTPAASAAHHSGAEDDFFALQERAVIVSALASLTSRHRRLLASVAFEAVPSTELAADEGVDAQAIRAVVRRARQSFRSAYTRMLEQGLAAVPAWAKRAFVRLRSGPQATEPFGRVVEVVTLALGTVLATMASAVPTTGAAATTVGQGISGKQTVEVVPRHSLGNEVARPPSHDHRPHHSSTGSTAPARPGGEPESSDDGVATLRNHALATEVVVGRQGSGGELTVSREHEGHRTLLFVEIENCDATLISQLECTAFGAAEDHIAHGG